MLVAVDDAESHRSPSLMRPTISLIRAVGEPSFFPD